MKIGVFLGGNSSERAISLRSGKAVSEALSRLGLKNLCVDPAKPAQIKAAFPEIDLAFLTLHGRGGEDGSFQDFLEKEGIPYVGSDPRGSRLAFNKVAAKRLFQKRGIPTPPWRTIQRGNWQGLRNFPTPFFVKPVAEGSSIGVFLVEDFARAAEKIIHAL